MTGSTRIPDDPEAVEKALERYRPLVADWQAFCRAVRRPLPRCVWLHPGRPEALAAALADGFVLRPLPWHPSAAVVEDGPDLVDSLAYRAGLLHVQEEAALAAVRMLDPRPGERVLDLCAAPGNKAAEIALAMRGTGTVVANDLSGARLSVARSTIGRLGLVNVATTALDGRDRAMPAGYFDRVLVDAPCSCDGTVRKHPRAAVRTGADARSRLAGLQRELLGAAVRACRPGGRIVYATCSFAPEENEAVVADVLAADSSLRIVPVHLPGLDTSPGIDRWADRTFPASIRDAIRLWPHRVDSGGFFAALLEKSADLIDAEVAAEGSGTARRASDTLKRTPADAHPAIAWLEDRFGLRDGWRSGLRFRTVGDKYLTALSADLDIFDHGLSEGIVMARLRGYLPKPTTDAALHFWPFAGRNTVRLSRPDAFRYLSGESIPAAPDEGDRGYVLVAQGETPLGVGFFRPTENLLESLYPLRWAGLGRPTRCHLP